MLRAWSGERTLGSSGPVLAASAVSTLVRAVLLVRLPGFIKGDEVEVLEAAFRRALGLQVHVWEVRNLFLPDLIVAPFVAAAHRVGLVRPDALIMAGTIPFLAAGAVSILLVGSLAESWGLPPHVAGIAAWIYALDWIPLVYGSAAFPRAIAAMLILAAALAISRPAPTRCHAAIGGFLIALACTCRYGEVFFLVPLFVLVRDKERGIDRRLRLALIGGAGIGIVGLAGIADWLTWGRAFSSSKALIAYTLASLGSHSPVPTQPWYWYLWRTPHWIAPTAVFLAGHALSNRRMRSALWFIVLPVALLSLVPYKDYRYLQSVIPFAAILVAAGFEGATRRYGKRVAVTLLVLSFLWQFAGISKLRQRTAPALAVSASLPNDVHHVAFTQPWAYGGRLFLDNDTTLTQLALPPRVEEIAGLPADCDLVSFYAADESAALRDQLERSGFRRTGLVRGVTGKAVVVYDRRS